MKIEKLLESLKSQESFLKNTQFGHIEIHSQELGPGKSFKEEGQLDRFANSKSDDTEQIVVKSFNNKKTLFIATQEYYVIFVYDGINFSLSQFWKREDRKIETRPINREKLKTEILEHFSNTKSQKLAS